MSGLFLFLYRIRLFLLFLLLEGLCTYLVVSYNSYQSVAYLNSSNYVVARLMQTTNQVRDYFYLSTINGELAAENARLNKVLEGYQAAGERAQMDSLRDPRLGQFNYIVGKVINNSVSRYDNYLTLNKGTADGVQPGFAVVAPNGIVGQVKVCSPHFSTVTSVLHSKSKVSASIKRLNAFGSLQWEGGDPALAKLRFIPRHNRPKLGDTIVTSNLSTRFPGGVVIGRISRLSIPDNETFYDIDVRLSADLSTLQYVYVVQNRLQTERDSLELQTDPAMNYQ
jgi:rod shape-determining protein MreC